MRRLNSYTGILQAGACGVKQRVKSGGCIQVYEQLPWYELIARIIVLYLSIYNMMGGWMHFQVGLFKVWIFGMPS